MDNKFINFTIESGLKDWWETGEEDLQELLKALYKFYELSYNYGRNEFQKEMT